MVRRLNQRGAAAFEEVLIGSLLTMACAGSFFGMSVAVKNLIKTVYVDYNSFDLGRGCSERTCDQFTPVPAQPTNSGIGPYPITAGLGGGATNP